MAEVLELPQLVDQHRVAEVQVGRGGIEAGLDPQRLAAWRASAAGPRFDDQLVGAALEIDLSDDPAGLSH